MLGFDFLIKSLLDIEQGSARYAAKAALLAIILSSIVAATYMVVTNSTVQGDYPQNIFVLGLLLIIIAPVVETTILWMFVGWVSSFVKNSLWAIFIPSVFFAFLHSYPTPVRALIVLGPFVIFSTAIVAWRKRSNFIALVVAMVIHAGVNTVSFAGHVITSNITDDYELKRWEIYNNDLDLAIQKISKGDGGSAVLYLDHPILSKKDLQSYFSFISDFDEPAKENTSISLRCENDSGEEGFYYQWYFEYGALARVEIRSSLLEILPPSLFFDSVMPKKNRPERKQFMLKRMPISINKLSKNFGAPRDVKIIPNGIFYQWSFDKCFVNNKEFISTELKPSIINVIYYTEKNVILYSVNFPLFKFSPDVVDNYLQ